MRIALTMLLVALAVPAAAIAGGGRHHTHHTTATMSTKNAAWICKGLRAHDPRAFTRAFGTNRTARNAFGKCVSAHARSKKTGAVTLTFHHVTVNSTGSVTNAGTSGCQTSTAGCTIMSTGTLTGTVGGTYVSTWTIMWAQATSNGQGGYCAPATGTTTLSLPAIGTLTKSEHGTVCEVGATGTNVEHMLSNGTFTLASGTGRLAGSTGTGTLWFDQKPGATSALGGAVTGSETFATLTVKA